MGFNSFDYIVFLSFTFIIFWQISNNRNLRNGFLLLASYFFYAAWNGYFVVILLSSTLIDYYCGLLLFNSTFIFKRKLYLYISIASNLSVLFFFKYINFFISNSNSFFDLVAFDYKVPAFSILLPIGISFYTFQSMSYTLDIYFKKVEKAYNFSEFALFVSFFSQLVAGPIVRASEFLDQLAHKPILNSKEFGDGLFLILKGLVKKMIIADYIAKAIVEITFNTPSVYSSYEITFALLAFHFQVYCDFSGYTDIAIGSAKLFGLKLPINFNSPYKAHSPSDFWKRWHMTLSRFAFDYIYVPLGGSKKGSFKTYRNIFITFAVIGFWHGANWNYILFGIYHAIGVMASRFFEKNFRISNISKYKILLILLTNIYIILSLPLFCCTNLKSAFTIYSKLISISKFNFNYSFLAIILVLVAIISHYLPHKTYIKIKNIFSEQNVFVQTALALVVCFLIYRMNELKSMPFIYFQF